MTASRKTPATASAHSNQMRLDEVGDPEIATRINAFEMAFRMQTAAPDVMDISKEPKHILEMYGAQPGKSSFANTCLLARRLVEQGVRFVEIFHEAWDQHGGLVSGLKKNCGDTDKACAALVKDLKQRGLLDSTLRGLGRRVRPDADGPGRLRRPRSSPQLLYHVAGRRRRQGRQRPSARATSSASTPPATKFTSTTCTQRSCICSASTTRS